MILYRVELNELAVWHGWLLLLVQNLSRACIVKALKEKRMNRSTAICVLQKSFQVFAPTLLKRCYSVRRDIETDFPLRNKTMICFFPFDV